MRKQISNFKFLISKDESGVIIIGALIVTGLFLVSSLAVAEFSASHYFSARRTLIAADALEAAEAGADNFMYNINADSNYQGTNGAPSGTSNSCTFSASPVTLTSNTNQGKLTYQTCVQNSSTSGEKIITATGKVYIPSSSANPTVTRKVRLVINQQLPASYTVITGPGGLILGNNVKITAGPVFVGGKLTMGNNSSIGTATNPVNTYVGDKACPSPADSTFPKACTSGNSITVNNGAHVYGDTHVLNNVSDSSAFTNNGVVDHTVPDISLPMADHNTLTSSISNSHSMSDTSCSGGNLHLSGHYTGSSTTTLTIANNCTVTLDGDTWIDGNISLGNNAVITTAGTLTTPPNVIIDGSTGFVTGNNNVLKANASEIGFEVFTFWSADSSCRPTCANVTGSALANSQALTTINISNNTTGTPGIKFYSRWTKLVLANNTTVGELIGQTIDLENNGSILFSDPAGSATPTGWDVRYYEQIFN